MYRVSRGRIYLALYIVLLAEMRFPAGFYFFSSVPDLVAVYVIFAGLFWGPGAGLEVGIAAGVVKDLLDVSFLGANILAYGAIGALAAFLSNKVYRDSYIAQALIVFSSISVISRFNMPAAFYTTLIAPFAFLVLGKLSVLRESDR